ncbi:MAG: type I methionyl aminopeptidase [Clostridia bacterium]|nr:type I methionyl aminopeptidase [Oscillospiraceae bacterium]MDY5626392.1 type I methionyl aminopeptidase [Clostridia bacterium]
MIYIKSAGEVAKMRRSGKITANVFEVLKPYIKPGVSTAELDKIAKEYILNSEAKPSFLNYNGFPASICSSVNDVVIHGIPSHSEILKDGDIISIDVGVIKEGYHSDAARTFAVGNISEDAARLIDVTQKSFFEGIRYAKQGERLFSISATIQDYVEGAGFSIVKNYCGHGVGRNLHEDPEIPNYGKFGHGNRLMRNMTLAIEPMVNMGGAATKVLSDGWKVVTQDKSYAAHYENTIVITDGEPIILTAL